MAEQSKYYLSTIEFLAYSGTSKRTLYREIENGKIALTRRDNKKLFHYTQLPDEKAQEDFLKDRHLLAIQDNQTDEKKNLVDLKPWERSVADKRLAIIEEFINVSKDVPKGKMTPFKRRFAKSYSIKRRTLDRWVTTFKSGGYYALIPGWNNGEQDGIIDRKMSKFIDNTYMKPLGPSKKETYELLIEQFGDKREKLPHYRTVVDYINSKWTKANQTLIRNKELWDRLYSPYVRRDWGKVKLNEVWVGDAKQIDIACMFRGKAVFPWFTAFLDARSRKFVGWIVTPIHDSWTIAQSFVYGVSQHGVPETIYVDRGKPYKSLLIAGTKVKKGKDEKLFQDIEKTIIPGVIRELGSEIYFAAPYNAREKIIEPNFKVFTLRMKNLPGYRGHSIKHRPKKLANEIKTGKLLSFEELYNEVDRIINDRNNRPHSTTGKIPNSYYENYMPVIPSKDFLAYLLMDSCIKKVKDSTINIKELVYRHDELFKICGELVEVRRDPRDIRSAAVIYKGKIFCFASLETPGHYRGPVTLESVKTCQRITKKIIKYRKEIIENEQLIDNPLEMAVDLEEKGQIKPRDVRPASSKVKSLHAKERVAKDIVKGLQKKNDEEIPGALEQDIAVGENIISRYLRSFKPGNRRESEKPKYRLVKHLTLDDPFVEEDSF